MNRHDRRKFRAITTATSHRPSGQERRTRRETNRLLIIFGGISAAFILTVLWLILDRVTTDLTVFLPSGQHSAMADQWLESLRDAGFHVHVKKEPDLAGRRSRLHIPPEFAAEICAVTLNPARYVLSGFVPPDAVVRMLREQPSFQGLTLPDEPQGGAPSTDKHGRDIWGFWSDGQKELFLHRETDTDKPPHSRGRPKALARKDEARVASATTARG
jgi:hypothetical protein